MTNHDISTVCSALSHPSRVQVFMALLPEAREGISTGALSKQLEIPPSTLVHHLRELELGGLITRQALGRSTLVKPRFEALTNIADAFTRLCCATETHPFPNSKSDTTS